MDMLPTVPCKPLKRSSTIFESYNLAHDTLNGCPIQELNEFAAQLSDSSSGDLGLNSVNNMQLAGQLSSLSYAYWKHHQLKGDTDIEGLRGQELQERAYDLLRKRLGKWHPHTIGALSQLAQWDINIVRRQQYLEEFTLSNKRHDGYGALQMMVELAKCCLRNGDYGAGGKSLRTSLQRIVGYLSEYGRTGDLCDESRIALLYVQIKQNDWDAADQFDLAALVPQHGPYRWPDQKLWLPKNCSTWMDLQIFLGTLDRAERAIIKGVVAETSLNFSYRPCTDLLMEVYLGQADQNLQKAESWLSTLIGEGWRGRYTSVTEDLHSPRSRKLASKLVGVKKWEPSPSYYIPPKRQYALYLLRLHKYQYQLADVYVRQRRYEEARPLLEGVVKANLHRKNLDSLGSKQLLVTPYLEVRDLNKAEPLQEAVVEDITETFGEGSEELLPALRLLSRIYRMTGQWQKKHEVDLRILRYRE